MDKDIVLEFEKNIKQMPAAEVSDELWDVIIIGAGPAGSTAAIHLASKGHRVLLIDKEKFPREKVCGDGLINGSIRDLEEIGLIDKVRKIGYNSEVATVYSPTGVSLSIPGKYITLRRSILDALIAAESLRRGAVFCQGEIKDISSDHSNHTCVSFANHSKLIRAKFCIIATGAQISLAKRLGFIEQTSPTAIAVRCYMRSSIKIDHLLGSYEPSLLPGYGWIFPMGNNEYNVGVIAGYNKMKKNKMNLTEAFYEFVERFPIANRLFKDGQMLTPLLGGSLRCGLEGASSRVIGNMLCAGEVLGTTVPCTYEGIGKAMESGKLAAHVINEALTSGIVGKIKEYHELFAREMQPKYKGYKIAFKWLNGSPGTIGRLMVHRVEKSKFLRKIAIGVVSGTEDPRQIFSFRGVWRLLRS